MKIKGLGVRIGRGVVMLALLVGCGPTVAVGEEAEAEAESIEVQVSEIDEMKQVYIPAGVFQMGAAEEDAEAEGDEYPQHEVYLDGYWIDQMEVSNAQYRLCVEAGACTEPEGNEYYADGQYDDYPVVDVTWEEAQAYCAWAGRELPTEAQWEKAARGSEGNIYPWGNEFDGTLLNYCDANCENSWRDEGVDDGYAQIAPVGSYAGGASEYGVLDMGGNVSEWVADWYGEGYDSEGDNENPTGPEEGEYKVIRGGSWYHAKEDTRAGSRSSIGAEYRKDTLGFRCVMSDKLAEATEVEEVEETSEGTGDDQAYQIAFASDRDEDYEIYVMDADGGHVIQLTDNDSDDWCPTWSPDGEQIAFMSVQDGDYEIYVMDADGSNVKQLTFDGRDFIPAWSPVGKQIAFVSDRDGYSEIYVMDADGSNVTRLTFNYITDWAPAWSPDGEQIVFSSGQDGYYGIYMIDADGSNVTQLTDNDSNDQQPSWSPDGKQIAFVSARDGDYGDYEIYVMDADGGNVTQLTLNEDVDSNPAWSPDGKQIAFVSDRDGDDEIYVMDADGSNVTQLTANEDIDIHPSWSLACGAKESEGSVASDMQSLNTGNLHGTIRGADGITAILCDEMKMGFKVGFNNEPAECIGNFQSKTIIENDEFFFSDVPEGSYILYFEIPNELNDVVENINLCQKNKSYYLDWEIDNFIRFTCYDSETFADNYIEIKKGETTQYSMLN